MPFDDLDMSATGDGTLFISFNSEPTNSTAPGKRFGEPRLSGRCGLRQQLLRPATFANGTYLYNGGLHRSRRKPPRIGNHDSTMIADLGRARTSTMTGTCRRSSRNRPSISPDRHAVTRRCDTRGLAAIRLVRPRDVFPSEPVDRRRNPPGQPS